ncbi:MAG: hypothetical protein WDM86_04770 [Rhizomicrobium sp.]
MDETKTVKIEARGGDQMVHLPEEFHLPGDTARVRRVGKNIVLEPIEGEKPATHADVDAWFARIDRHAQGRFMEGGREQPAMPDDDPSEMFE